jgi:hypothetical protein
LSPKHTGAKMTIRKLLIAGMIVSFPTLTLAQQMGTPIQRAACGPAVRKYCAKIKPSDGGLAYQQCLEANRPRIGAKCQMVLDGKL